MNLDRRSRTVRAFVPAASDVEAEMEDVAVVDDVLLALLAHLAGVLGGLLAAQGDEALVVDRLRLDEAALEIGVADAGGFRRRGSLLHGPCAGLLGADGEEGADRKSGG